MPKRWYGHAVVQVNVWALDEFVRSRIAFYDPSFLSADPRFCHAHITALAPIYDWDETAIAQVAANTAPFEIELAKVQIFPDGVIYLLPEPDTDLRKLSRKLWRAHPYVEPNGMPDPQPHLTLDAQSQQVNVASTRQLLGERVPLKVKVASIDLVWYEAGDCHVINSWPLGA